MKQEVEIIDTMGNVLFPSISIPFLTDVDGKKTTQRRQISIYIQDQEEKESFLCLDIEAAILLTDAIERLSGQILLEEAREQVDLYAWRINSFNNFNEQKIPL